MENSITVFVVIPTGGARDRVVSAGPVADLSNAAFARGSGGYRDGRHHGVWTWLRIDVGLPMRQCQAKPTMT
jgi:hypothetical protein